VQIEFKSNAGGMVEGLTWSVGDSANEAKKIK